MFLLAYAIFFTNIAFILRLLFSSCRVTQETYNHSDISEDDSSDSENNEDDELLRAYILNNKKRKRAERPSTPHEEDNHDKETTFYENF